MNLLATIIDEPRSVFEFAGLPDGWLRLLGLLAFVGICYAVVWLYRREGRAGASPAVRLTLGVIRCTILTLLAVIWLQPVIATYTKRTIRAGVAVLIDDSASMAIRDAAADSSSASADAPRIDQVRTLLTSQEHEWLQRLREKNDLSVYTFGQQVRRVRLPWEAAASQPTDVTPDEPAAAEGGDGPAADRLIPLTALQSRTDLGEALARVLGDMGDRPVAAVIVLSDGIVNYGLGDDELTAYAKAFRAPVHTVGVGSAVEPPNARITNFAAPAAIAKGDPLELRIEAAALGVGPTPLKVELLVRPVAASTDATAVAGEERLVGEREVIVGDEQPPAELRFRVNADVAGEFLYRARVAAVAGEAIEYDNTRAASVTVLDEKLRVLLIAGRPTYDYRAVTALLGRDRTMELSCWLQSADAQAVRDGSAVITELPSKPEDLFAYDVVVLMDPDPRELDSSWAVAVRRLVDELGGGLCLQAGPLYTSRFFRDERLADVASLLPIQPDPDADVRLSERGSFSTQVQAMRVPDDARGHPALTLNADLAVNRAIWDALPGVWWYLPVLREKPVATVLLRVGGQSGLGRSVGDGAASSGGGAVLMAAQPLGAGRTVYIGFDGTWRWRATAERAFNRFWVQLVRYLAQARRQGVSRRGTIVLDRESLNVGEYVRIEARVLDANFLPWHEPEVLAHLETADGRTRDLSLTAIPGREGWYAGRIAPDQDGPAVLRIPLPGSDAASGGPVAADRSRGADSASLSGGAHRSEPQALVKHMTVLRPDLELRALRLRNDTLMKLSEATGGRYVAIATARDLPAMIENASLVRPIEGPKYDLWDRSWVMILIAGLLGAEWYVRRRNHLL